MKSTGSRFELAQLLYHQSLKYFYSNFHHHYYYCYYNHCYYNYIITTTTALQTFRNYREVFEKQKVAMESRYRELLDDAIQDAIFLSTRNNELMDESSQLQTGTAAGTRPYYLWLI